MIGHSHRINFAGSNGLSFENLSNGLDWKIGRIRMFVSIKPFDGYMENDRYPAIMSDV